ncbi:hypothetical protein FLONG3_5292 [Fusarium longipes]|uniref:Uncharacterized protein n=1 Tax=Fusarium longipes TaxID=694270 RepID=A0A395SV88_9HYPO|nr:hypothetical protein FLONG3_5292 [Fusarium longipes]
MTKRRRMSDNLSRKRRRITNNQLQPPYPLPTTDVANRLNNQSVYYVLKKIDKDIENLEDQRERMLKKMLPTSDGREMKYEDFATVQRDAPEPTNLQEAKVKIEDLQQKNLFWELERRSLYKKDDKREESIKELRGHLEAVEKRLNMIGKLIMD